MPRKLTYEEIQISRLTEAAASASDKRLPVIAILEDIRSLYNVGSIFRTGDGAHLEAIYTVGYTPHPGDASERARKEIEKTALGATRTVPHKHFATVAEAVVNLKNDECRMMNDEAGRTSSFIIPHSSFKVAALEIASDSRSIFQMSAADFPLALIIGNEVTGVSSDALALCDFALEIPMLGAKHSLNVAVATGIALFECVRVLRDA